MRIDYFNPRSREGSDFYTLDNLRRIPDFNPRSREGSDCEPEEFLRAYVDFNPRSREGSDVSRRCFPSFKYHFNPRSREGSDTDAPIVYTPAIVFQSTLPRGERQDDLATVARIDKISIHAPARGATGDPTMQIEYMISISIHAPARGATILNRCKGGNYENFNPRSREGSDCAPS